MSAPRADRRVRTLRLARRGLLTAAAVGGVMLAGAPAAGAAALPDPVVPTILGLASPLGAAPVIGGFGDSVVGIVIGTYYGIVGASSAVLCPMVTPLCASVPTN